MSQARKLILHIGFPKTGSSAIQSWLAKNTAALAQHGIAYRQFREEAADDEISIGNGKMLLDAFRAKDPTFATVSRQFEKAFIPTYFGDHDTAIISGEGLASARPERLEWLKRLCTAHQVNVTTILYCRSVYGHCYSVYQQLVKRSGETATFPDYADKYDNFQCERIWTWHSHFGNVLNVRLYDAVRKDLIRDFARAIGIDQLDLSTLQENVNRSLTFSELELLRKLNAYHKGVLSAHVSDALIYANPGKASDHRFDPAIAGDFERRFGADVQKVNEAFFASGPDRLAVSLPPDAQPRESGSQEPEVTLDPTLEIVLKTLGEGAAKAKEQERRTRGRLSVALAKIALADGELEPAAQHLLRALKINPNNRGAFSQLSKVRAKLGDQEGQNESNRAPANYEARRVAHRQPRNEQTNTESGNRVAGTLEKPRPGPQREARERLANIKSRLREIADERARLVAERARLLDERKVGREQN